MNLLELDIIEDTTSDTPDLRLDLKIDGEEFLKRIDSTLNAAFFPELKKSKIQEGAYLIFTCSCGVADCGGWQKVKVWHQTDKIAWEFEYDNKQYNFEFDPLYYKGEIDRMSFEIEQKKLKLQPEFVVEPE